MKLKNIFGIFILFLLMISLSSSVLAVNGVYDGDKIVADLDVAVDIASLDIETKVVFEEEKNIEISQLSFWNKLKYTFRSFNVFSSLDNIDGRPCDDDYSYRKYYGPSTGTTPIFGSLIGEWIYYTCPSDNYGCVVQLFYDEECDGTAVFSDEYRVYGGQPAGLIPAGDGTYYYHWYVLNGECARIDSYECNYDDITRTCDDTDDGKDVWEYGTMSYCENDDCYGPLEEYCVDGDYVFERWCDSTHSPNSEKMACIDGYCVDGECIPDSASDCVDSDGGKNYSEQGTVTWTAKPFTDYCSEGKLVENFCYNNERDYEYYTCPTGQECSAGACIPLSTTDFCTETGDVGLDFGTYGEVTTEDGIFKDVCSGSTLTEYACSGNEKTSVSENCANGCSDGKCIGVVSGGIDLYDITVPQEVIKGQQYEINGYAKISGSCEGCVIESSLKYYGEPSSKSLDVIELSSGVGVCGDQETVGIKFDADNGDIVKFKLIDWATQVGNFDVPIYATSNCYDDDPVHYQLYETYPFEISVVQYEPPEITCYWCLDGEEKSQVYELETCPSGTYSTHQDCDDGVSDKITCYFCVGEEEKSIIVNGNACEDNTYSEEDFEGCDGDNLVSCYYCSSSGDVVEVKKESCDIVGLTDDENLKCGESEEGDCANNPYDPACRLEYCDAHPDASICKVDCNKYPNDPACKVGIDIMWYWIGGGFLFLLLLIILFTGGGVKKGGRRK